MKKIFTILLILFSFLQVQAQKDWYPYLSTDSLEVIDSTYIVGRDTFTLANSQNFQILQKVNGIWTNRTVKFAYDSIKFNALDGYLRGYKDGIIDSTLFDGRYFLYADSLLKVATPKQLYDSIQAIQPFDSIAFKSTALKSFSPYTMFADTANKTIGVYNGDSNVLMQLGEEMWVPICYNNSGSTILNGKPVYINSAISNHPTIRLADKTTYTSSRMIGVATEDIPNGSYGRVTRFGYVNGINLSSFSAGDDIYLGEAGNLTNIKPVAGNYPILIGKVINNTISGRLLVYPQTSEYTAEANRLSGFPDYSDTYTSISINNTTRYFKISPVGTSFYYYDEGIKYIKSSPDSVLFSNVEGRHYIYYQNGTLVDGVNLTNSQIINVIENDVPIAGFYWDATNGAAIGTENNRYIFPMSTSTRAWLRTILGIQYINDGGLTPTNLIVDGDGSLNTQAQFGFTAGNLFHEDIKAAISAVASTTGIPCYYRLGTNGDWRKQVVPGYSFIYTTFAQWNEYTGTTWQLTTASSGSFILVHIFAVPSTSGYPQLISVVGQHVYATISDARAAAPTAISNLNLGNVPIENAKPIATFILETKSNFTNTPHSRYVSYSPTEDYIDWRTTALSGVGGGGTVSQSFIALVDVPSTYSGKQDSAVYVNSTADGLIFKRPEYLRDTANIAYLNQLNTFSKSVNTTGVYQTNGTQIATSDLSDNTNIAKLNQANTFTQNVNTTGVYQTNGTQIASTDLSDGSTLATLTTSSLTNYYTKTNLQTSGQAAVHWGNITNTPTTLSGYGIVASSSDLTDGSNIAKLNANQTFTGNNLFNTTTDTQLHFGRTATSIGDAYIGANASDALISTTQTLTTPFRVAQGAASNSLYVNGSGNTLLNTTTDNGYKLNVNGTGYFNGNVNTTSNYLVNGTQISSSNLSDGSNLAKYSSDFVYTGSSFNLVSNQADGSNTGRTAIGGGGAITTSQGAYLIVGGNENTTYPGIATLMNGNSTGSYVKLGTPTLINTAINNGIDQLQVNGSGYFSNGVNSATTYKVNGNQIASTNLSDSNRMSIIRGDTINYYALGNSITYGFGSTSGSTSWADILNARCNFASYTKLAVSGATAMPTTGRYKLSDEVAAIGATANLITVMIGVNDYNVNNYIGDVDSVLAKTYATLNQNLSFAEAFRYNMETIKLNHEYANIYVILPLQSTATGTIPLQRFRDVEIAICNYLSIPVIDASKSSELWTGGTMFVDGTHPNDNGYKVLADYIFKKILSNGDDINKSEQSTKISHLYDDVNLLGTTSGYVQYLSGGSFATSPLQVSGTNVLIGVTANSANYRFGVGGGAGFYSASSAAPTGTSLWITKDFGATYTGFNWQLGASDEATMYIGTGTAFSKAFQMDQSRNLNLYGNVSTTGSLSATTATFTSVGTSTGYKPLWVTSGGVLTTTLPTAQIVTYSATPTQDYLSGNNATITLTGNITTYTISNVPDGGQGDIVVVQNATGGYGISSFASTGLTVKYINNTPPTSANINSSANGVSVVSYHRVGTYLLITYGSF